MSTLLQKWELEKGYHLQHHHYNNNMQLSVNVDKLSLFRRS